MNILIFFDGYKLVSENLGIDLSINQEWLSYVIENYLTNGFLLIDDNFFTIEEDFLVQIVNYVAKFEKLVIKLRLHRSGINFFNKIFVISNVNDCKKLSLIKSLKLIGNELNDENFIHTIPIFKTTTSLTELEISKNFISGESLKLLSSIFQNHLKNVEKLNFSSNWIDSFCVDDFMKNAFDHLPKITYIDLSNNFLDNEFLKAFDFYLRKCKQDKQEITLDLSKNRFDSHTAKYKFYKHLEEENKLIDVIEIKNEKVYSLIHFMDNLV